MSTTTQLKVTLPAQMRKMLKAKADEFGLTMSSYTKNLVINDLRDLDVPVRRASKWTEKSYRRAMKEIEEGNTVSYEEFKELLKDD